MRRMTLLLLGLLLCLPLNSKGESGPSLLNIHVDETGMAHVTAVLEFSGTPTATRAVLMDYRRWPALFPHGLRVAAGKLENGIVVTDLYVSRYFLPGELHLITETRETESGRLETRMIQGDFLHYRRIWRLSSANRVHPSNGTQEAIAPFSGRRDGEMTRAELEMEVLPKMWIPRWVFTIILKRELTEHFAKLQEEVAARSIP